MNKEYVFVGTAQLKTRDYINQLQQENQKYKEVIDKAMEYINKNLIVVSILDGVETFGLNSYTFDYKKLLDILKGGGINE